MAPSLSLQPFSQWPLVPPYAIFLLVTLSVLGERQLKAYPLFVAWDHCPEQPGRDNGPILQVSFHPPRAERLDCALEWPIMPSRGCGLLVDVVSISFFRGLGLMKEYVMRMRIVESCAIVAALVASTVALASDWGLKSGTADLKSAGSLAFGPDGILLVGDTKGAAVFAIDTSDTSGKPSEVFLSIDGLNKKVADALDSDVREVQINDLAVNPASGNVYLSISKGRDESAKPALLRVDASGSLSTLR